MPACELCEQPGGIVLVRRDRWRLVRVDDALYPGTYRLIWNAHVSEFSDLDDAQREQCMRAVAQVERLMRAHLQPQKINLAALGNVVPHLHWHLIARDPLDAHFPQAIWGARQREPDGALLARWRAALPALDEALVRTFS